MGSGEQTRWEETAAAVAHELSTPLAVAQGSLQALLNATSDDQVSDLVGVALRSMRSMELQIERFRRLDGASADDPVVHATDLAALTRELVADLDGSLLHDHPTDVVAPDHLEVMIDPGQIRQVLYNLLSNAAKYSPSGREIVVSIERAEDEIVLQVRDRGDGVAPDDAERIFDKYERGDAAAPGVGLGLFLSQLIVEAHGGSIGLEPAEGEGSIFEVRLPMEPSHR